ncbi:MAG TPA: hypothetical protein VGN69_09145 [Solirubrobacteraceae bacterium]|jgi:hypothetical protein|nr:hypothetical protein [Solirubrobacteraceae bacterium]
MSDEDVGEPIAYTALQRGTAVFAEGGVAVGKVREVLGAQDKDIFHGLVVHTQDGDRFVAAEHVGPIHERAVALRLDAEQAAALPRSSAHPPLRAGGAGETVEASLGELRDMARHAWERLTRR